MLPITLAGNMFLPLTANRPGIQKTMTIESIGGEQVFSPFPQWTAKPTVNRNAKPHFGPLHKLPGHIAIQHLAENPFADSVPDLEAKRKSPREFNNSMINQGNTGFQAGGHAGSVHLGEDVIREIIH